MAVHVERHGNAVVVTIDRPERRNALDGETIGLIGAAFSAAEVDDDTQVVVLTGAGEQAFCAGMDLKEFARGRARRHVWPGPGSRCSRPAATRSRCWLRSTGAR